MAIKECSQGNYSEGKVLLLDLLNERPNSPSVLYNLGLCYSEINVLDKSVETLLKCVEIKPDFPNAYVALGYTLSQQKKCYNSGVLKQLRAINHYSS